MIIRIEFVLEPAKITQKIKNNFAKLLYYKVMKVQRTFENLRDGSGNNSYFSSLTQGKVHELL